ncbi:Probable flavin-containing monoamine oxidase B [Durusdinium trenchii]|uniref:Probable flavin-containing monoamine oxidase B n=1 Tax=Durusdinium trenchii TaxID=1381693 RepID=A0ABP0LMP0_9DINO
MEAVAPFARKAIRPFMPEQHRRFFEKIPLIFIGALDGDGRPWASAAFGEPGFMQTPNETTLHIDGKILAGDALDLQNEPGAKLGLVGLELETRRRNRMNGSVVEKNDDGFSIRVEQSFGNCPQYIQRRETSWRSTPNESIKTDAIERTGEISPAAKALIETADTFFIASRTPALNDSPHNGVDASHRGGRPGFVYVDQSGRLSFPDFSGNRLFNTLGNIEADGRAGLFFPDFETGDAVFLTGRAEIQWDDPRVELFTGAQRVIDVFPEDVVLVRSAIPLRGAFIDYAPQLERTGPDLDLRAADMTNAEAVHTVIQSLIAEFGPPKIVVHNTASLVIQNFEQTSLEDFENTWRSMVFSAAVLGQAVLKPMVRGGGGAFIVSGATASIRGGAKFSAFASAKFALRGLTQALARDYQTAGVHVAHVILDGIIDSPRSRDLHSLDPARMMDPNDIADAADVDYQLVEARNRFGGRIHGATAANGACYDLGPTWFWPGQPRMLDLTQRFNLSVFDQYADGALIYEDEYGRVQRGMGFSSMAGSWRIAGGAPALIDALTSTLDKERLHTEVKVTRIERDGDFIKTHTHAARQAIVSRRIILAVPPRVLTASIDFAPALSAAATNAMNAVPTWMAGQAKVIALYEKPFWRDEGLSGDAMSRRGPMVEIHDASPAEGGPYALFGFIGTPPQIRQRDRAAFLAAVREQLRRLFGQQASEPQTLHYYDWAFDPETATPLDHAPPAHHPAYGLNPALQELWDGRLLLSATETAPQFGGYLEGALEAAERAAAEIKADSLQAVE